MGVEQGGACCIADDGCGRFACSHAGKEAGLRRMGVEQGVACSIDDDSGSYPLSNKALLAALIMIAAAILCVRAVMRGRCHVPWALEFTLLESSLVIAVQLFAVLSRW